MPSAREQRRFARHACVLEASLSGDATKVFEPPLMVRLVNVSNVGIGLHAAFGFEVGARLTVKVYSKDGPSLPARAVRVIHATEQPNTSWMVGAEFLETLTEAELALLV